MLKLTAGSVGDKDHFANCDHMSASSRKGERNREKGRRSFTQDHVSIRKSVSREAKRSLRIIEAKHFPDYNLKATERSRRIPCSLSAFTAITNQRSTVPRSLYKLMYTTQTEINKRSAV